MKTILTSWKIIFSVFLITPCASCMMVMHTMHDNKDSSNQNHNKNIAIDPVCGAEVDKNTEFRYLYNDRVYYFESAECMMVFRKNPGKFIHNAGYYNRKIPLTIAGGILMGTMMILMMSFLFYRW